MQPHWIFYPAIALAFFTLAVGLRMLQWRIHAVKQDGLKPTYFRLNRDGEPPDYLVQVSQHYQNLFELPVLFYVICLFIYVTNRVDSAFVLLAWLYVATRIAHAIIHMGRNRLLPRRNVFLLSTLVLYTLWGKLTVELLMM